MRTTVGGGQWSVSCPGTPLHPEVIDVTPHFTLSTN
jgi:hypothetical protein